MAMFVQETGVPDAPPIILIHGLITSGWMWQQQAQLLEDFHCLIPDLPAHGHSSHIPWASIEDTAQQVANLIMGQASRSRVHVIGLSLGSLIALQVMHLIPGQVGRVILSGTNLRPLPLRMRVMSLAMRPFMKTEFFVHRASQGLRLSAAATDLYRRSVQAISIRTILKITGQAAAFHLPAELGSTQIPVLIAAGEKEHPLVHQSMQILLASLPCSKAYLAPTGRHGWLGETPELFAQMARAWFTESPLPTDLIPVKAGT